MAKFELSRLSNAAATDTLGFEQLISTQTEIVAGVIETKYYELLGQNLSDFVSFDVGRGAYSTNVFQYTSAYVGSPFESGIVQPSTSLGINAKSSIQIDGISIKNNFCLKHNYKLIRIPYYDLNKFTLEDIFSEKYLVKGGIFCD